MTSEAILDLLSERDFARVRELLNDMHAVDAAALLQELPVAETVLAFRLLDKQHALSVFEQMQPDDQHHLLESFHTVRAGELFGSLSPDDRARLLDEVPATVARRLLQLLDPTERAATLALLGYEENTAGRFMTPDFVDVRLDMTVAQALERVRRLAPRKETIYYAYVMDEQRRLIGVISLRELVIADPVARIGDVMTLEPKFVYTFTDQQETSRTMSDYDLLAVPVVDRERRLVGIVTFDDAMDIIEEAATEQMLRMSGVGVKERADSPLMESMRRRVPWLAFNMGWAFMGAFVISLFEGTISRVAAVAVFMPIISGQAGNVGIQTATITVRAIALGELDAGDTMRMLRREWAMGAVKGLLFGLVLGLIAWVWKDNGWLGAVAGTALFLNMFVASTTGVLIPMTLRRLGMDPAAIAGVFDTMISDLMGFLIYLGLATIFIVYLVK